MKDCCAAQGELADELDELAADPTLQACCQRDLQEQAHVARVKAQLLAHDRTDARRLVADGAVRRDFVGRPDGDADSLASSSDDESADLERMREQRLIDLKEQARRKAQLQSAGYGRLTTEELRRSEAEQLVCHLVTPGTELGQQLDEHLTGLAHLHLGTRFLRTLLLRGSRLPRALGLKHTPALVCFREGAMAACASVYALCGGMDLHEEDITRWLRRVGALRAPGQAAAPSGAPATDNSSSEDDGDGEADWREPCSECGRRYYHEHVRAVHGSEADSTDDELG